MKRALRPEVLPGCSQPRNVAAETSLEGAARDSSIHAGFRYEELFQRMHPDLFAHLSRVEFYVRLFCLEMAACGCQEACICHCLLWGKAAFFHDIGKMRIPQAILMKSGKLSAEENAIVREHPKYAEELLMALKSTPLFSNDPELFDSAVAASLSHHEWWNGAGYPFGIAGQGIPLIARITSICDAFDTITYGRPYCNARSAYDAFSEIKKCAGSQFDPVLSVFFAEHGDAFLKYVRMPSTNSIG